MELAKQTTADDNSIWLYLDGEEDDNNDVDGQREMVCAGNMKQVSSKPITQKTNENDVPHLAKSSRVARYSNMLKQDKRS